MHLNVLPLLSGAELRRSHEQDRAPCSVSSALCRFLCCELGAPGDARLLCASLPLMHWYLVLLLICFSWAFTFSCLNFWWCSSDSWSDWHKDGISLPFPLFYSFSSSCVVPVNFEQCYLGLLISVCYKKISCYMASGRSLKTKSEPSSLLNGGFLGSRNNVLASP